MVYDDYMEENDNQSTAVGIIIDEYQDLELYDDDWYNISLAAGENFSIDFDFNGYYSMVQIYDPLGNCLFNQTGYYSMYYMNQSVDLSGDYSIFVSISTFGIPTSYDMTLNILLDDNLEDNDEEGSASIIFLETPYTDLIMWDDDWYVISIAPIQRFMYIILHLLRKMCKS